MAKRRAESATITRGTKNVFEDLGYPDAAERQAKLRLAYALNQVLEQRELSQSDAAKVLGVTPTSSGPAGSHFEAQVGASYLLSMLTGGEPRGLPGMVIDRIELQRASEGRPLDDVIVHAHDPSGTAAVLEIQVKREIAFSP